jgi:hypothetical protein
MAAGKPRKSRGSHFRPEEPDNTWTYNPPNWTHQNNGYHKGAKKFSSQTVASATSITLTVVARVKLWWWYNLAQAAVTGHLAPWAWVRVTYTVHKAGQTEVVFGGSGVPSQNHYVDWNLHSSHDMTANGAAQVRAFLEKGNCLDADLVAASQHP